MFKRLLCTSIYFNSSKTNQVHWYFLTCTLKKNPDKSDVGITKQTLVSGLGMLGELVYLQTILVITGTQGQLPYMSRVFVWKSRDSNMLAIMTEHAKKKCQVQTYLNDTWLFVLTHLYLCEKKHVASLLFNQSPLRNFNVFLLVLTPKHCPVI